MSELEAIRSAETLVGHVLASEAEEDFEEGEKLAVQMAEAWKRGQRISAKEMLSREPSLLASPRTGVRLVYEEVCLREETGLRVSLPELLEDFPQWREELEVLLAWRQVWDEPETPWPQAGQRYREFDLLRSLGSGAAGSVFLARQPNLSDRPLVLKLTRRRGSEHLSLARLQHAAIVPLHFAFDDDERNLRGLVMPFLGGESLAAALRGMEPLDAARRSGRDLARRLKTLPIDGPPAGPCLEFFESAPWPDVVCWIGAALADGLAHAHERGLLHLDVKPSNVLLAADGQPMLLDFHLAQRPLAPTEETISSIGGTAGYMAPEQQEALAAARQRRPVEREVGPRADVYSLGATLYECLTGRLPGATLRLREANPQVTPGLEAIICRCLATRPEGRYASAREVADDLRRHLFDLPLRGVRNRSLRERWRKWRRRRRQAPAMAAACVAVAAALGLLWNNYAARTEEARGALDESRRHLEENLAPAAMEDARRGLETLAWIPGQSSLRRRLQRQAERAGRAALADQLHEALDRLRMLYGAGTVDMGTIDVGTVDPGTARLVATCQRIWEARARMLPAPEAADDERARRLRDDLLDLAILSGDLATRLSGADPAAEHRQALATLDEAERTLGLSAPLCLAQAVHARALGREERANRCELQAGSLPRRGAWEHYACGRFSLRVGDLAAAHRDFRRAVRRDPRSFWANYSLALCAHRLGRFHEALQANSACVALAPDRAAPYYHRGLAYVELGDTDAALRDFEAALRRDPSLPEAARERDILLRRLGAADPVDRSL